MDDYKFLDPREEGFTLDDAADEAERRKRRGVAPASVRAYDPESRGGGGGGSKTNNAAKGGVRSRDYDRNAGVQRDWKGQTGKERPRETGRAANYNEPRPSAGGGW